MPPSIYETALQYKRQLANKELVAMRGLARRWLTVMGGLDADMQDLARIVAARRAAGLPITAGYLYRNERYLALLHQANGQFEKFAGVSASALAQNQAAFARLGRESAIKELELATAGIKGSFERINPEIAENVAGFLSNTSPLKTLLEDAWPNSVQQTTSALVRGINLGYGPERVARMMAQGISTALNRAIVIARTETMRVYRTTKFDTWESTGIVSGYKRVATHDSRTCPACLFLDGEIIKNPSDFAEHPQGRCTVIPLVRGGTVPKWQEGPEWFEKQPESTQIGILGKGKHEAWKAGKFNLRDVPDVVDNATWGKSLRVKTLPELLGGPPPPRVVVPPVQPSSPVVVNVPKAPYDLSDGTRIREQWTKAVDTQRIQREAAENVIDDYHTQIRSIRTEAREAMREFPMGWDDDIYAESQNKIAVIEEQKRLMRERLETLKLTERELLLRSARVDPADALEIEYTLKAFTRTPAMKDKLDKAKEFIQSITSRKGSTLKSEVHKDTTGRAFANSGKITISKDETISTIIHELGHNIEDLGGAAYRAKRMAFFDNRTAGDVIEKLADLHPGAGYRSNEIVKRDKWMSEYMGKIYSFDTDSYSSSEIISMGIQYLYQQPTIFASQDPEYFDFIIAYLRDTL